MQSMEKKNKELHQELVDAQTLIKNNEETIASKYFECLFI